MSLEDWEKANASFMDGTLLSCDTPTLQKHLLALSNQQIRNETIQHRDVIRGLTINHILLQRHIDSLNKQNLKTQKLVVVLAVAALISSVFQIFSPLLFQSQPIASAKQTPVTQSVSPIQVKPQASGQATKKAP